MSKEEYIQRLCQQELERNSGCGQPMLATIIIAIVLVIFPSIYLLKIFILCYNVFRDYFI